jgi:BirA family biotin operon repressor/biotin-[acetyl-CoA-carboxylase] ligase
LLQMKDVNQNPLNKKIINSFLDSNEFHKVKILIFEEIDSTNRYLSDLEIDKKTLYICSSEKQIRGKGRGNKKWESPTGQNIYLSLSFQLEKNSNLNGYSLMVGLAIRDSLNELYGINSKIKWPNDIFFENRKFCGILIETKFENNLLKIIVGIGINVFMQTNDHIDQDWTSLKLIDGEKKFDRNLIIGKLTSKILNYSKTFEKYGFAHFQNAFNQHNYLKNKIVTSENFKGKDCRVKEVDTEGKLKVEIEKEAKLISSGELSFKIKE